MHEVSRNVALPPPLASPAKMAGTSWLQHAQLQPRVVGPHLLKSLGCLAIKYESESGVWIKGCPNSYTRKVSRHLMTGVKVHRYRKLLSRITASSATSIDFPLDYVHLIEQVKASTTIALQDSKLLLEIEFPTAGLQSVPGDAEGGIEMNMSMELIRDFCQIFGGSRAVRTRIFFPDVSEVDSARKTVFEGTPFQLDFLTRPSGLQDFGFGTKVKMADRAQENDEVFVVAYPYFNVNEMLAVEELYRDSAQASGRPIIVFNGELDRIRSGYYPSFFYPKLGAIGKTFLPKFETVYYIHNFKGRLGGTLFRAYPGPWRVLRKINHRFTCIHEQETMPSLKEVALNILTAM